MVYIDYMAEKAKRGRPPKPGIRKRVQMTLSPDLAAFIDTIGPDELAA